jgi:hypothetical protein
MKYKVLAALATIAPSMVMAYGVGYSTYPMLPGAKLVSTEFTGITSSGGGIGMQARYTQNLTKEMTVDAGLGISGGERSSRFFAGMDYELFPDYENQPRISLKTTLVNAKEFENRFNIISVAPTVSKGFSFWGQEAYPYFSLPFGVRLNDTAKSYETTVNASAGASTQMPFDGYEKLTANAEVTVSLKDSWTGVFLGVSYPLN